MKGSDFSAEDNVVEIFSSILVSSASKENLELMITKIIDIKKSLESKESKAKTTPIDPATSKVQLKKKPVLEI